MPLALQTRKTVYGKVEKGVVVTFSLPEDVLPGQTDNETIFCGSDFEFKFPGGENERLRALLEGLLPQERCAKVDFVYIARRKTNTSRNTDFKLVCPADQRAVTLKGRVDAALRIYGYEFDFELKQ
jgi:hypothetical protein